MFVHLKTIWEWLKTNRWLYLGSLAAVALATTFSYIAPLIIRLTLDSIIGDQVIEAPTFIVAWIEWIGGRSALAKNLWICSGILILAAVLQGFFTYLKGRWSALAAENLARDLREQLYDHLQHLPFSYHAKAATGDLIQRCTSDVDTVRNFVVLQLPEIGRAIIMLALMIPIIVSLDVTMALLSLAIVPVILTIAVAFYSRVKSTFELADEAEGELSTVLQENLTGVRVVRAFARQDYEIAKYEAKNRGFRDKNFRVMLLLATYWSFSDFLCMTQIALVTVVGVMRAVDGIISLGTLVVFITYNGMLMWPVRHLGKILTDLGMAVVSLTRIKEILQTPLEGSAEPAANIRLTEVRGEIVFDRVNFAYHDDIPILRDIHFRVRAGQTMAIMGPTGSGKTSLVNLLPRLYNYQSGRITLDGQELQTFDRKWLRSQIGIVLQEPFLFSKTIGDNIRFGNPLADLRQVEEAAGAAAIHQVITGFEKGYETLVGERGVTLSGGQKQRVAIARAIIKNPAILIFDDSLSAVDTETEVRIQQALKSRRGLATTFVIAHRLTTVMAADLIAVLEHGRIVEIGTHDELVNRAGMYRRVWDIQNSLEADFQNVIDNGQ